MNEQIIELLLNGRVRIVFRKLENNLIRNLLCTLNKDFIPSEQLYVLAKVMPNLGSGRFIVWDIEKNAWRSFYPNTVIDVIEVDSLNKDEKRDSNGESKEEDQQGQ